jgi:hypothetical protein
MDDVTLVQVLHQRFFVFTPLNTIPLLLNNHLSHAREVCDT